MMRKLKLEWDVDYRDGKLGSGKTLRKRGFMSSTKVLGRFTGEAARFLLPYRVDIPGSEQNRSLRV